MHIHFICSSMSQAGDYVEVVDIDLGNALVVLTFPVTPTLNCVLLARLNIFRLKSCAVHTKSLLYSEFVF